MHFLKVQVLTIFIHILTIQKKFYSTFLKFEEHFSKQNINNFHPKTNDKSILQPIFKKFKSIF